MAAQKIIQYCRSTGKTLAYISGNGGSGKTELAKTIVKEAERYGRSNAIDLDEFVVDTKLRNSASTTWNDPESGVRTGRYTTAFPASYFLQNVKAILYNIECGNNYYHWPKKAMDSKECRLLSGDAIMTVVDGAGTVFLERDANKSISIFMKCSKEIEIARRIQRGRFSNEQSEEQVLKDYGERNSQYRAMIEPHMTKYGLVLDSLEDYSLGIVRDDYGI
jgi:uridine kinase